MDSTRLSEIPLAERPRERLMRGGASALSDAELLAIFIRTGTKGRNAVSVARQLLDQLGGLHGVARCKTVPELTKGIKGIGAAKACELLAVSEIGRRIAAGNTARPKLDSPQKIYDLVAPEMQNLRVECLRVLLLNTRYELISMEDVSLGSVNESIAHPREIFRPALIHSAYAIAVVHNHPSGDPSPSHADREMTRKLHEASQILSIRLLDHVIIGDAANGRKPYTSFSELGLL